VFNLKKHFLTFGYRLSARIPFRFLSAFSSLKRNLDKAGFRTGFRIYLGLLFLTSIVAGVAAFAVSLLVLYVSSFNLLLALAIAGGTGALGGLSSMGLFYSYPAIVASNKGRQIDGNLPLIANFMAILASSGMPPEKIFRSLSRVGKEFKLEKESRGIIRDVEFLGMDIFAALKGAAERSPNKEWANLLEGIVATTHLGGDLSVYLQEASAKYRKLRMLKLRQFLDNLGAIAETYVAFMVAAPLMLIVMLSVMSFLGGGIGAYSTQVLLYLMTYVVLPLGVFFLIVVVDALVPPR